jgi:hypothetical protein
VVDSGEVGRSAVYSRYINGSRTLPWSNARIDWQEFCVLSLTRHLREVSAMQI